MKPLAQLINVEKARLLHQLFPDEIPVFLSFAAGIAEIETDMQDRQVAQPPQLGIPAERWRELAQTTEEKIRRYGKLLHQQSRLFADQLFDGQQSLFMVYVLQLYTEVRQPRDRKFKQAVQLLFF